MVHSFPAFFCVVIHIRQSSTGLSPSCVPSRTFSESFRLAHNYIPASTGANSMDSEEENKLMNEAEDLQSQLKQAGDPVEERYSEFFFKKLQTKSTAAERIPLWIARVESFRVRLEKAVSPVVGGGLVTVAHNDLPQNNLTRKEPEIGPESQPEPPSRKPQRNQKYTVNTDGSPCTMRSDHVEFIRMCVDELKKNQWLEANELYRIWREKFKAAYPDKRDTLSKGLFGNRYITMQHLLDMSRGLLPLPVAHRTGQKRKRARSQGAADGIAPRRGRPKKAAGAGDGCKSGQGSDGELM